MVRVAPRPKQLAQSSAFAGVTSTGVEKYANRRSLTMRGERTLVSAGDALIRLVDTARPARWQAHRSEEGEGAVAIVRVPREEIVARTELHVDSRVDLIPDVRTGEDPAECGKLAHRLN